MFSEDNKIWLIDFAGNDIAKFDAPHSRTFGHASGVPLKSRSDKPEYFAILVNFRHWEILSEPCAAIAAFPVDNSDAETLLVGCSGKIWQYKAQK